VNRYFVALVVLVVAAMAAATVAQAQTNGNGVADAPTPPEVESGYILEGPPPTDPKWGIQDYVVWTLGPADFIRLWSCEFDGIPDYNDLHYISPAVGETTICIGAPVHLPTGAHLENIALIYHDELSSTEPYVLLYSVFGYTQTLLAEIEPLPFNGGDRTRYFVQDYTVPAKNTSHSVYAVLHRSGTAYQAIYAIVFWMKLQISPAPATATFPNVPTSHWAFQFVEALAASGITQGQPDGNFHPADPVTRAQMATFLCRALGLHWDI